MTDTTASESGGSAATAQHGSASEAPDVDRIAERVYRLMMDEVRLMRARSASGGTRDGG
jgi:hypothetical protein